jgi:hypothetical protein
MAMTPAIALAPSALTGDIGLAGLFKLTPRSAAICEIAPKVRGAFASMRATELDFIVPDAVSVDAGLPIRMASRATNWPTVVDEGPAASIGPEMTITNKKSAVADTRDAFLLMMLSPPLPGTHTAGAERYNRTAAAPKARLTPVDL